MRWRQYTADDGNVYAIQATTETAAFMSMLLADGQPLLGHAVTTRKIRLADAVTGKELLVVAPSGDFDYPLLELAAFSGSIYLVVEHLEERGRPSAHG